MKIYSIPTADHKEKITMHTEVFFYYIPQKIQIEHTIYSLINHPLQIFKSNFAGFSICFLIHSSFEILCHQTAFEIMFQITDVPKSSHTAMSRTQFSHSGGGQESPHPGKSA